MTEPDNHGSLIDGLARGEQGAAARLWECYFEKIVRQVRRKLPGHLRRAFDEEDIALSAFQSFCEGVGEGRFPRLQEPDNLWSILLVLAARKTRSYLRHHNSQKRGGGEVLGESALFPTRQDTGPASIDQLTSAAPGPEIAAQMAEDYQRLLEVLGDEELQTIAILKMEGFTVEEMATQVGSTRRTIERRLQIIRRTWRDQDVE